MGYPDRATKLRPYVNRKNESSYLLNFHDSSFVYYIENAYRMLLRDLQTVCMKQGKHCVNQHHLPLIQYGFEWLEINRYTELKERLNCRWDVARQLKNKTYNKEGMFIELTETEFMKLLNLMNEVYKLWQSFDKFIERMQENAYPGTYDSEHPQRKENAALYAMELVYKYYPLPELKRQNFYKLTLRIEYVAWWGLIKCVDSFYQCNELQETRRDREIYNELFEKMKKKKTVKQDEIEIRERLVKIGHSFVYMFPPIQKMLNEELEV